MISRRSVFNLGSKNL